MWYKKYESLPYKHLGTDPKTGIDCFNLCKLIYKERLNIDIPYTTNDFCNITDATAWYQGFTDFPMERAATKQYGWDRIIKTTTWANELRLYDLVLMKIGSTNCVNHCAIVVDMGNRYKKLLHTMMDNPSGSWVAPYGHRYEDWTEIVVRWIGLNN